MSKVFTDVLGIENNVYTAKKFKATPLVQTKSSNAFINALANTTTTENGATTNISTLSPVVDWFYHSAALRREANEKRILNLFVNAFNENPTDALRVLFYTRDVRGGQGERRVFRICMKYLGDAESAWVTSNLNLIADYGRYDDYLCLLDTTCRDAVIDFLGTQLEKDLKHHLAGEITSISLLGKWLPSENTSRAETRRLAKILLRSGKFGAPKAYRKALTLLRGDLNIVENKLRTKQYADIDYAKLPSYAALKYRKAFYRGDETRYSDYINAVIEGKEIDGKVVTINAETLYPYDLIRPYYQDGTWGNPLDGARLDKTVEAQWKALPDYMSEMNGLVVCDTSGSMNGEPIRVAMSLAVYVAERNKSETWKNLVVPFSSTAQFMEVRGNTLLDRLKSIFTGDCSNTDLQAVFDLVLDRATSAKVPVEDMPKVLMIISDMEFDCCGGKSTNFEKIRDRYQAAGYPLPNLMWWNVNSRSNQAPVTVNDTGTILVSGCSPTILKTALSGEFDPMTTVRSVVDRERYTQINY